MSIDLKVDRESIRIKVEFLFHSICEVWRSGANMSQEQLTDAVSLMATAGGFTIHRNRLRGVIVMNQEEAVRGRVVAKLLVMEMNTLFQKLHRETTGLPITLSIPKETMVIMQCCEKITNELMDLYEGRKPFPKLEDIASPGSFLKLSAPPAWKQVPDV